MSVSDEQIGRNVARLRGDRSQKDVADAMRERGWKWSQTTVWKVESGERPLRLAEAEDLGEALGSGFFPLTADDENAKLRLRMREVSAAHARLLEAMDAFNDAQLQLAMQATHTVPDNNQTASALGWMDLSPESVAKEWRVRHEAEGVKEATIYGDPVGEETGADMDQGPFLNAFNETWKRETDRGEPEAED